MFEGAVWKYTEPSVGMMSVCLPFLSRILGKKVLGVIAYVSKVGSAVQRLFRRHIALDIVNGSNAPSLPEHNYQSITKHVAIMVDITRRYEVTHLQESSHYTESYPGPSGDRGVYSVISLI